MRLVICVLSLFVFACGADIADSQETNVDGVEQGLGEQASHGGGCKGGGGFHKLRVQDVGNILSSRDDPTVTIDSAFSNLCKVAVWSNLCPINGQFEVDVPDPGPTADPKE